jgi:hypothetical protein
MSSTKVSTYETNLRAILGDPDTALLSQDRVYACLTNAYREVLNRYDFPEMTNTENITTTINQKYIAPTCMASDYLNRVMDVIITSTGVRLDHTSVVDYNMISEENGTSSGTPKYWVEMSGGTTAPVGSQRIFITPKPSAAIGLTIYYQYLPAVFSSANHHTELQQCWDNVILYYAVAEAAMQLRMTNDAIQFRQYAKTLEDEAIKSLPKPSLSTFEKNLRAMLGNPDTTLLSHNVIYDIFTQSYRELLARHDFPDLMNTESITTTAYQAYVDLTALSNANCQRITGIVDAETGAVLDHLTQEDYMDIGATSGLYTGYPTGWLQMAGGTTSEVGHYRVYLFPIPDTARTLITYYQFLPNAFTSFTTTTKIPPHWDGVILHYAAAEAAARLKMWDDAVKFRQYAKGLEDEFAKDLPKASYIITDIGTPSKFGE